MATSSAHLFFSFVTYEEQCITNKFSVVPCLFFFISHHVDLFRNGEFNDLKLHHVCKVTVNFFKSCPAHEVPDFERDNVTNLDSIYLWTVGSGNTERVVYVGKRGGENGHVYVVAWKLLDPEYKDLEKKVYFGTVKIECYQEGDFPDDPSFSVTVDIPAEIEASRNAVNFYQGEFPNPADEKENDDFLAIVHEWQDHEHRLPNLLNLYDEIIDCLETVMISDWLENPPRAQNAPLIPMFNEGRQSPPNTPIVECKFLPGILLQRDGMPPCAGYTTRIKNNMKGKHYASIEPRRNGQDFEDEDDY
jgi:hypothetical protein